ncbi:MAG: helix-turn-helix domain-containing protein [Desulfosudaceae bacterium]
MTGPNKIFPGIQNSYALSLSVFLLLSFIAVSLFYPLFQTGRPRWEIPLSGPWKISLDDNPAFARPEYDDVAWDRIRLPGQLVPYSREKGRGDRGICWLRKTIRIDEAGGDAGLILGCIANADQAYINGEKIGETGQFPPDEFSMWNYPRTYLVPAKLLRAGQDNLIAVRVSYHIMGEVIGTLKLTDADYMKGYAPFARFIHVSIGYAAISIGLILTLAFLFTHLKHLEFNENYFYFLQFFVGLPIILELCLTWQAYPDPNTRLIVLGLSWVAINVFHPAFLHRFYRLERARPEKLLWAYLVICTVIAVFFVTDDNLRFLGSLLIGFTWCIGIYNISCHVEALIRGRDHARLFSLFGLAAILAAMNDGFIYFNKFVDPDLTLFGWEPTLMIMPVGALLLYIGTFLVLEVRYNKMVEEIDDLNRDLENFIIKNSLLSKSLEQGKSSRSATLITPQTEEKILAAIDLIRENYLSELSRADLARTVGVHPDSLGKQFKQYTGKKLGDYIYELRIHEAARRLRETDDNIINIAFDVGFESLRTFNRVFPRFMNVTPREYRRQHRGGSSHVSDS